VFSIFHVFIFEFWGLVSRCFSIQAASNDSTSSTSLFPYTIMSYLSLMLQAYEEDKRKLWEEEADFNTLPKCKIDEASTKEAKDWVQTVAE